MKKCRALTKKGNRCPIGANPGEDLCHVHSPYAEFRKQHPNMTIRMIPMTLPPSLTGWQSWQLG